MHPADPNIAMLEAVVTTLGTLADKMVFVGGCAAGLLITDTAAPVPRRHSCSSSAPGFGKSLL